MWFLSVLDTTVNTVNIQDITITIWTHSYPKGFMFCVLGESTLDFFYYFAVEANDTHPGLRRLEGSPIAGKLSLLVC